MGATRANSQFKLALPFLVKSSLSSRAAKLHSAIGGKQGYQDGDDLLSCTALAEMASYLEHRRAQAAENKPRVFEMKSLAEYEIQIRLFLMRQEVTERFDPNGGDMHGMIEELIKVGSPGRPVRLFIICERWHPTRFKQVEILTTTASADVENYQLTVVYADGRRTFD